MQLAGTPPGGAQLPKRRPTMRQAVRDRILSEILAMVRAKRENGPGEGDARAAGAGSGRFVMVLDPRSTRVLSSALHSHDLGEQGVILVENFAKARQPFPHLEAIYVLDPTAQNLDQIARDFYYWDAPLYARAHVFLIRKPSSLQDENLVKGLRNALKGYAMKRKKSSALDKNRRSRLATLVEANIDFLAVEDNAFHLDLPKGLVQLFGPSEEEAVWCENRIVDGVVSLCATLNEYPFIRYAQGNALCENLARNLHSRVQQLISDDPNFWWHGKDSGVQGVVLFLDRRQDLAAPLLHEFTYQALVYDLLETRDNLVRYKEPRKADESLEEYEQRRNKRKKALLNETDPLWVQFRHAHISVVLEQLGRITRELKESTVGKYQSQDPANVELEEMGQVVKEMQIFKEVMAKHVMHLAICQSLMDQVNDRALIEQARTEQTFVTGVDGEGERSSESKSLNDLSALMRRNEPSPNDKLRLACLHAVVLGQASRDVVQRFIKDAQLPIEEENALSGLGALGVSLVGAATASSGFGGAWLRKKTKPLYGLETPYRAPESIERYSKQAKNTRLKVSRFAPLVKSHVESICYNKMTMESFPFVFPPPLNSGLGGAPIDLDSEIGGSAAHRVSTVDRSLSVRKHTSQINKEGMSTSAEVSKVLGQEGSTTGSTLAPQEQIVYQGGRVIVFIAGGVSYSELRAIHEVMRLTKREVIIGSTHFTTPEDFLNDLRILGDDEKARQYLEEDGLSAKASEFFLDDEEKKMLNDVLIDRQMDPEEMKKAEEDEANKAKQELEQEAELGIIPWLAGMIPCCGASLRAWFNGDDVPIDADVEIEDDGLEGDFKKCFSVLCPCLVKAKEVTDKVPLLAQPQPQGQVI